MWRIISIGAENIVSFKRLKYQVKHGVATLIFGENLDGTNQRHNGSGKSALIEAISLALTGDYLREIKTTEELINDDADTCTVQICLENDFDGHMFTIKRTISRKEAQVIECHQFDSASQEINTENTIQPTVADYNKFILSEIGLTKDDIYSNFILCRNKYVSFLSAKDKDKKELINRFSNGIIVDESIEALQADMEPVQQNFNEQHDEVVRYNARIETINEQIANAELNKEKALQTKAEKIEALQEKIAQKRAEIRETNETIKKSDERLDLIDELGDNIEELEKSDKPLAELYQAIKELFESNHLQAISDYSSRLESANNTCERKKQQLAELAVQQKSAIKNLDIINKRYEEICKEHEELVSNSESEIAEYQKAIDAAKKKMEKIDGYIEDCNATIKKSRALRIELASVIDDAKVKLNGAITCPKCKHKFILSSEQSVPELELLIEQKEKEWKDADEKMSIAKKDAEDLANEKEEYQKKQTNNSAEIRKITEKIENHSRLVEDVLKDVRTEEYNLSRINRNIEDITQEVAHATKQIKTYHKSMFDDAFDIIDAAIKKGEDYVASLKDKTKYAKEVIAQYEESIEELKKPITDDGQAALKESLKEYQEKLEEAEATYAETNAQMNNLKQQKEYFVQFKSFLANTKIDAITQIINGFLEEIGSDIRVSIEGFRVLKSGKLSEKITVNMLRNGVDCGSFQKFSCGERARVELASILAIQTLTNATCEDGKGLDFLVIDEVLDGMDESGIMAAADTLNKLHKTSMVITQGHVAENYENTLVVTKQNGVSTID